MIPELRKAAQLNIKYRKNGGPTIGVCIRAPPNEVTALLAMHCSMLLSFWLAYPVKLKDSLLFTKCLV